MSLSFISVQFNNLILVSPQVQLCSASCILSNSSVHTTWLWERTEWYRAILWFVGAVFNYGTFAWMALSAREKKLELAAVGGLISCEQNLLLAESECERCHCSVAMNWFPAILSNRICETTYHFAWCIFTLMMSIDCPEMVSNWNKKW